MIRETDPVQALSGERDLLSEIECLFEAVSGRLPGRDDELLSWEIRVASAAEGATLPEPSVDGGVRLDRIDATTGRSVGHRFAVGGIPTSLDTVGSTAARAGSGEREWLRLVSHARDLFGALSERAREPTSALRELAGSRGVSCRTWMRLRVLRRKGLPVSSIVERGVRFAAYAHDAAQGRWRSPIYEWTGSDPRCAPWTTEPEAIEARLKRHGRWTCGAATPIPDRYAGPVVLAPKVAARWLHELAHAGLESIVPVTARSHAGPGRLVDDPRRASWPFGFSLDDHGGFAREAVLWGEGADERRDSIVGRWRRGSIRESAMPALSLTRLDVGTRPVVPLADLPAGTPFFDEAGAARLEPNAGQVLIEASAADASGDDGERGVCRRALLTLDAEQSWQGSSVVAPSEENAYALEARVVSAVCTRLGQRQHVLVGAPTIVLDRVRL